MVDFGQAAIGIIVMLIVVGGLLYIFWSRSNAVEKTGYGSLIMLTLVSLMIPVFWIMEGQHQASAQNEQHALAIERGVELYAQNCTDNCYGIESVGRENKVINPTYLGYTLSELAKEGDDELERILSGGVYNPDPGVGAPPPPSNTNTIPRSDRFGGQLQDTYVQYMMAFIRSTDPEYAKKEGLTGEAAHNGLELLPDYLQTNNPEQFKAAQEFAAVGQFGEPVDMTAQNAVTINMVLPKEGQTCTPHCYDPVNVKVKVGTVITWVNGSDQPHTVTAKNMEGQDAPEIFDSGKDTLIQTGESYEYTVTKEAFDLNPEKHTLLYYCIIHPQMLAQLTIVE